MNENTNPGTIHGHPLDDDGRTCIFFAQCPENSDIDLYLSVYESMLSEGKDTARRCAEAYMSGRLTRQMIDARQALEMAA